MDQLRRHDIEAQAPPFAESKNGAAGQPQAESRTSTVQAEEPQSNGSVRVSRTPSKPPPPIRPRKKSRFWRIAGAVMFFLILAVWRWLPLSPQTLSHSALQRELQTSEESLVQLQEQHQETQQLLQATRFELESVQNKLRDANRKLAMQQHRTSDQARPGSSLHKRLSRILQPLVQSRTATFNQYRERLILRLEAAFLFDPEQFTLRRAGREVLDQITAVLLDFPGYGMQITWHIHFDDTKESEWERWTAVWPPAALRASHTGFYLTTQGLTSDRFSVAGSFVYPFSGTTGLGGRSAKPQVEIILYPIES